MLPSPLGDGVGHSNARSPIGPFTCVPAYSFPVYGSQQAVRKTRCRMLARPCTRLPLQAPVPHELKAQPPQIRTSGCRIRLLDRWLRYAPSRTRVQDPAPAAMATAIGATKRLSGPVRLSGVRGDAVCWPSFPPPVPPAGAPFPPRGLVGSIPPLRRYYETRRLLAVHPPALRCLRPASCALGFSWTLDCERVLAGGVSR